MNLKEISSRIDAIERTEHRFTIAVVAVAMFVIVGLIVTF